MMEKATMQHAHGTSDPSDPTFVSVKQVDRLDDDDNPCKTPCHTDNGWGFFFNDVFFSG